jgi:hypothetical protein
VHRRPRHEVAEIFQRYLNSEAGEGARAWNPQQWAVANAILACRTARLGGHVDACDACGHTEISYNSCRNRHCPKCQGSVQAGWLEARQAEVLPTPYAHVVFTLPHALAPLALQNPSVVYDLLLRTAASTLQDVAANPLHLGARLGFFAILHTWGQTLVHHPHVHCVVPAGGLAEDGTWKPCRPGFFLPVRPLSRLFHGRFLATLAQAFRDGRLTFHGRLVRYRHPAAFNRLLHEARGTEWVVYAKPPFDGPEKVLEYLARYTHRVAISNYRLVHVDPETVTFRYKDYRSCRSRSQTLPLGEFCRRFLLHVLPKGFVRIRYYGFLANGTRARLLSRCREALGQLAAKAEPDTGPADDGQPFADLLPRDRRRCPHCKTGSLRCVQLLERPPPGPRCCRVAA